MKQLTWILILMVATGCAGLQGPKNHFIDPEFQPYVDLFESLDGGRKTESSIIFTSIKSIQAGVIGICHKYGANSPRNWIEIDRNYWNTMIDSGREELIFHELGHCTLDRSHDMGIVSIGGVDIVKSIMYPMIILNGNYETFRQYYWSELFDNNLLTNSWFQTKLEVIEN